MLDRPATTLICVPPHLMVQMWPAVAGMIDEAYAAVDLVTPDVLAWLQTGKGLLWIAMRGSDVVAVLTTSLERRRSGRLTCRMVSAGAEALVFTTAHLPEIEHYARAEGCYKVEFEGRQGWGRVLPGYVPKTVSYEKVL